MVCRSLQLIQVCVLAWLNELDDAVLRTDNQPSVGRTIGASRDGEEEGSKDSGGAHSESERWRSVGTGGTTATRTHVLIASSRLFTIFRCPS